MGREKSRNATQILRAGNFYPAQEVTPVTGVLGGGRMEDEAQPNPIGPTPWRFFGDFLGVQKVTRRRSGEIPL